MWKSEMVKYWRNYVPPCRPSLYELEILRQKIKEVRINNLSKPKVLILGTTNEFRDIAYIENCEVTIVDSSLEYHKQISDDRIFKNSKEKLVISSWEEMTFVKEFDIIIGDLIVGNINKDLLNITLKNIKLALKDDGIFITKSFFNLNIKDDITLDNIFEKYEANHFNEDPFPYFAYFLTIEAVNKKTNILNFHDMFKILEKAFYDKKITENTFNRYADFGWQNDGKIEFHVIHQKDWELLITKIFKSFIVEFAPYNWADKFPIYVISNK